MDRFGPTVRVLFEKEGSGEPVGTYPWVPVVHGPANVREPHPPEIITPKAGRKDAAAGFEPDAFAQKQGYRVELRAQKVIGPREQHACLGRKQVDRGLGRIGQAAPFFLHVKMSRQAPVRFFAYGPDAIRNIVQKAALAFHAFGNDLGGKSATAAEMDSLVPGAVAIAGEIEQDRGLWGRPFSVQAFFSELYLRLPQLLGQGLPGRVVGRNRVWAPFLRGKKGLDNGGFAECAGQKIARPRVRGIEH